MKGYVLVSFRQSAQHQANQARGSKKDLNMASRREAVLLPGILRGGGKEITCTVRATKVSLSESFGLPVAVAYCEYSIQSLSKVLPEGRYQLSVNAEVIPMQYQSGLWLALM
jgi:hypothetical protein